MPTTTETPVVAERRQAKLGLLERIKDAASVEEVDTLLAEGATFKLAHKSTRNRWNKAATKRRAFLGAKTA